MIPEELVQRCIEAFTSGQHLPPDIAALRPGQKALIAAALRLRIGGMVKPIKTWFGVSDGNLTYSRMILVHGKPEDIEGAWEGKFGYSPSSTIQRIRRRQLAEGSRVERPTRNLVFRNIREAIESIGHCPSPAETARIAIDVSRGSMDIDRIKRAAQWLKDFEDEYAKLSRDNEAA